MADLKPVEAKMNKVADSLEAEYGTIRAGRANPTILDKVRVDYYGTPTPVNAVAAVSVPEARTLLIQPWDPSTLKAIEKAILASDIGINPQSDGKVIRLSFPPLTEERRRDIVKSVHKYAEEAKVSVRNVRRDALEAFKDQKKKSVITEDELKNIEKSIQDATDRVCKHIDGLAAAKEKEIMSV